MVMLWVVYRESTLEPRRENMQDLSGKGAAPRKKRRGLSTNSLFVLTMFIGIAMGAIFMTIVGFALWGFNYVCVFGVDCPPYEVVMTGPPADALPIYQTSEPSIATATPLPPSIIDIGATATAACSDFSIQFPGTPCPPQ